ncbi:hypothetical protein BW730_13655 [Tessaracoccus aquimaris]|uniref:CBS domain-containing protein n=1 Tax=Tessaracoccus aquimaris TaxID=1332264 RepID=A0A1Q2CQJ9_9ACTN|nr:CBS domain-containing protein [Tessaracoccus aquimaris]AQP48393.1 hypothetical protein BW730_13655 [Tessaracoccus aquimaris]
MTTAKDLMTSPAETLAPDATLADAARALANLGIGSMPVADGDTIVGVVTDRDIVVSGIAAGLDVNTATVADIATTDVVTVGVDDSAEAVAAALAEHQIRRVPVVDGGILVGVISQADVARDLDAADTGEVVKEISKD